MRCVQACDLELPGSLEAHLRGKGSFEDALLDLMWLAQKVQRKNEAGSWLAVLPAPSPRTRERAREYVWGSCGMRATLVEALGDALEFQPACPWRAANTI